MSIGQFRSTGTFAPRARALAPTADRATFVIVAMADRRFAAPVESVERVLRDPVASAVVPSPSAVGRTVAYAGARYDVADLAGALGLPRSPSTASRVLVLAGSGPRRAVVVDRVLEVATIDVGIVTAVGEGHDGIAVPPNAGARGVFTRHGAAVIVLDIARLLDEALLTAHGPDAASRLERPS